MVGAHASLLASVGAPVRSLEPVTGVRVECGSESASLVYGTAHAPNRFG